jgi:hypothetical protein
MKPFPLESISAYKQKYEKEGHPKFGIERSGRVYNCYILPQSKNPALPDYAVRMTPETGLLKASPAPEEITVFGISDSINAKVRDLVGGHEVDEFTQIGIEIKGRCARASYMEIGRLNNRNDLTESEKTDYLRMRRAFFRNLVAYAVAHELPREDIEEFTSSQRLFERMANKAG